MCDLELTVQSMVLRMEDGDVHPLPDDDGAMNWWQALIRSTRQTMADQYSERRAACRMTTCCANNTVRKSNPSRPVFWFGTTKTNSSVRSVAVY